MGLGPNSGSLIRDKLDDDGTGGDAVLDRIFQQSQASQNYITLLLNRQGDPSETFTGQLTISEIVSGYENVTNAPKLSVIKLPDLTDRDQHWQVYTDVDGIIGPDGQPISVDSIVPKAPDGQLVAVLDSGYTFPQVVQIGYIINISNLRLLPRCLDQWLTLYMAVCRVQCESLSILVMLLRSIL